MTARLLASTLPVLLSSLALCGCLSGEKIQVVNPPCCQGVQCSSGKVSRLSSGQDTGEGDNPCANCQVTSIGICADGCGLSTQTSIDGCDFAQTCKTWGRVSQGSACTNDRDCEPAAGGNTLTCQAGKCNFSAVKWANLTPVPCPTVSYGASADCTNQGACLGVLQTDTTYYCSVAKCIDSTDCPAGWHCRCQEQEVGDTSRRAWRWCVPTLATTDAGS